MALAACGGGAPTDGTQLANGKYTADALNVESTITATVTVTAIPMHSTHRLTLSSHRG